MYSGLGDTFVRGWRAYIAAGRQHEQIENLMKNSAGHHIQEKVGNFRLQYIYSTFQYRTQTVEPKASWALGDNATTQML